MCSGWRKAPDSMCSRSQVRWRCDAMCSISYAMVPQYVACRYGRDSAKVRGRDLDGRRNFVRIGSKDFARDAVIANALQPAFDAPFNNPDRKTRLETDRHSLLSPFEWKTQRGYHSCGPVREGKKCG